MNKTIYKALENVNTPADLRTILDDDNEQAYYEGYADEYPEVDADENYLSLYEFTDHIATANIMEDVTTEDIVDDAWETCPW